MSVFSQQSMPSDHVKVKAVWSKALVIPGHGILSDFRQDVFGNWIRLANYGDRDSHYGWEIDHIVPRSQGGTDDLINLRPLHWSVNSVRGGNTPFGRALLGG